MSLPIEFPLWIILLFLAACAAFLALSGIGIYYLVSKKFDELALIISASLLLALIIPKSFNPYHWAEVIKNLFDLIPLILLTLSFLAIFCVVNFIYRLI